MIKTLKKRFPKIKQLQKPLLEIAHKNGTPLYIFDKTEGQKNLRDLKSAFKKEKVNLNIFFAIKSNYYSGLLKTVVKEGEGLDASSERELKLALKAGAKKIIYTGPAKEKKDFELILKHASKITVNLESSRELKLLGTMAQKAKKMVRCGLRIITKSQDGWVKFGLPLKDYKNFYLATKKYKYLNFCGLHFHISLNETPTPYMKTLEELAQYFKKNFSKAELQKFEYIDIGGGFYPEVFEGIYTWNPDQVMKFFSSEEHFEKIIANKVHPRFLPIKVSPLPVLAKKISQTFKNKILPILPNVELYSESGRFICHSAMHILLKLVDIKNKNMGITDGGNNIVGWEKHQFFNYTPLFNLTHLSLKRETPFVVYGSLCTPDDIWGYYLYNKKIQEGDIILMPFQGAYTYTLAQEFIKDIPPVYDI